MGDSHLVWADTALLDEDDHFDDALSNNVAPENDATKSYSVMEPVFDSVKKVAGDDLAVCAVEWRFVGVVH